MDTKNKLIDQIFKLLAPLRSLYKDEVEKVTNDLLIGYTKSLDDFINKYFSNTNYSQELVSLIMTLVNQGVIPSTYLDEINKKVEVSYKQQSVRPLNVKIITFNNIQKNKNLTKLDLTKFPVSLVEDKEDSQVEVKVTNPNLTPLEITPDENTKPDIVLPTDTNSELPQFEIKGDAPLKENPIDFTIPDTTPPLDIPAIQVTPEPNVMPTLETQTVMSKDDIFNSLKEDTENVPDSEENVNPDLKNTSQFGQLLQFPLNNQTPSQEPVSINQELPQEVQPVSQDIYQTPTYQEPVNINQELPQEVQPINQDIYQTPSQEPVNINQELPQEVQTVNQDIYQTPTYQEPVNINQELPQEVQPVSQDIYQTPSQEPVNINQELPQEVQPVSQDIYQTPSQEPVNINQELPQEVQPVSQDIYQAPTYQEPVNINQELPQEEVPIKIPTEVTHEETKEELNEEITAKIREEVKKQVEQIRLEEKNNIVRIQNDYMNNANAFIQSLNEKSEEEIYMSLRYLNDLKYMSHCIAHLNMNTLERFYRYIEDKIHSPQSEFMDGFIEKRIRENLPMSLIEEINQESKKIA